MKEVAVVFGKFLLLFAACGAVGPLTLLLAIKFSPFAAVALLVIGGAALMTYLTTKRSRPT